MRATNRLSRGRQSSRSSAATKFVTTRFFSWAGSVVGHHVLSTTRRLGHPQAHARPADTIKHESRRLEHYDFAPRRATLRGPATYPAMHATNYATVRRPSHYAHARSCTHLGLPGRGAGIENAGYGGAGRSFAPSMIHFTSLHRLRDWCFARLYFGTSCASPSIPPHGCSHEACHLEPMGSGSRIPNARIPLDGGPHILVLDALCDASVRHKS